MSLTRSPFETISTGQFTALAIISVLFWLMTPTRGIFRVVTIALTIVAGLLTVLLVNRFQES